jgi:hypothetical protein
MKKILVKYWFCWAFVLISCIPPGNLNPLYSLPNDLKEVSAAEVFEGSKTVWMIEDQGNAAKVYGFDLTDKHPLKTITVENAENNDWEDLTSDNDGNLYIGDFGNNSGKRKEFSIYKLNTIAKAEHTIKAELISYSVPKKMEKEDFESFFLYKGYFYIFSKDDKKGTVIKVPNIVGNSEAKIVSEFNLKGKDGAITSADISADDTQIILLNHDKLWKLSNFKDDDFFSGTIEKQSFEHNTQKEGLCYLNTNTVIITDEQNGSEGGNVYSFNLNE